jgi:hypothetical protein
MDDTLRMNPALLMATLLAGGNLAAAPPPAAADSPAITALKAELVADARASGAGTVAFFRAYAYGPTAVWKNLPGQRVVAIEVEFTGHERAFDMDDIEIVDGDRDAPLEAGADFGFFDAQGRFAGWYDVDTGSTLHVLLMYQLPVAIKRVRLRYNGTWLLPKPVEIAAVGPVYPDPKKP